MNESSVFQSVMLVIMVVLLAMGVYTAHDHMNMTRQRIVATEEAMRDVAREVSRLRDDIRRGLVVTAPAGGDTGTGDATTSSQNRFANEDLRPLNATYGGQRVSSSTSFPGNVNPIVNNESTVGSIWASCNDSLAEAHLIDVTRYEPMLAESWETSEDGLTWTIHLRKNVLWHPYTDPVTKKDVAAKEVTADDFLFWWETIQNPAIPADVSRSYYEKCEGLVKIDDFTFQVVWKEPYSLIEKWTLVISPLPKHYYRPDPAWTDEEFAAQMLSSARNQHMIGCGPYRLERFQQGASIRMVRFEDYYGPKPFLRVREIKEIKDPEISFNELRKGNLDVISLQPEQWVKQSGEPEFHLVTPDPDNAVEDSHVYAEKKAAGKAPTEHTWEKFSYLSQAYYYIGYNMRRPMFKEREVRLAMTHLIDRERILKEVYYDLGTIITGPFVPMNPNYVHDIEPYPFDIEKAKALLKGQGWEDTDGDGLVDKDLDGDGTRDAFEFTFMTIASSPTQRKYVPIIKQDMAKAGVKVNIKPVEWSVYTEFLSKRNFDVCSLGWTIPLETDPYQVWHSSQAVAEGEGSNHVGYISEEADKLIEAGRSEMDAQKRLKIYQDFFRLVHHDQPYTFIFCPAARVAQHRRFQNSRVFATGLGTGLMYINANEQQTQ